MTLVIIGGGPSGMMACVSAINTNDKIYLIEKNEKLGKKMFITGKGRCNITNDSTGDNFFNNIITNKSFMYSSLNMLNIEDTKKFFIDNGCKIKVERGNRVFPLSDKSSDAIDAMKSFIKNNKDKIEVKLNTKVVDIKLNKDKNKIESVVIENIKHNKKETINTDKVIIATGGFTYQSTGSTGDGYNLAEKLGVKVKKVSPSLVPFFCEESEELRYISPLNLKNVNVKAYKNNKLIYEDFGEVYIRDGLIDGPTIISLSSIINTSYDIDFNINKNNEWFLEKCDNKDKYYIDIDLKPAITEEELDKRLLKEINENGKTKLNDLIKGYLPSKLIKPFINRLNIDNVNIADLKKADRKKIIHLLKSYQYNIVKKAGFNHAIVTHGGIDVNEINKKNMESKKIKGLYFAGEVIDVDCLTGGYNMQCALSTGYNSGRGGMDEDKK